MFPECRHLIKYGSAHLCENIYHGYKLTVFQATLTLSWPLCLTYGLMRKPISGLYKCVNEPIQALSCNSVKQSS